MSSVHRNQSQFVGMWLDQAGATIVTLEDGHDPVIQQVESNVESHYRLSGGWKSGMQTQDVADAKRVERKRRQQLERYYERLSEVLREATRVLILGPGEAKLHVATKMRHEGLGSKLRATEAADKMTTPRIVAHVRENLVGQGEMAGQSGLLDFDAFCAHFQVNKKSVPYAGKLLNGVSEKAGHINRLISKYAENWRLERMSVIDRNILRLAVYEMYFQNDVPVTVAINEAVEIAKRFSTDESGSFINGILDAMAKEEATGPEKTVKTG